MAETTLTLCSIVAVDRHWCIGKDNQIPWHLPLDFKHFKQVTMGHVLLMGRRTHESIGRALPGRRNMVLTTQANYEAAPECEIHTSLDAFFDSLTLASDERVFVIGGESVYRDTLPCVAEIYLTVVDTVVEGGDTFFVSLQEDEWEVVSSTHVEQDERHAHKFVMHHLRRRRDDAVVSAVPQSWLP